VIETKTELGWNEIESEWMLSLQVAISESKLLFKVHRIPLKVVQQPNRTAFVQFVFSEQKLLPKVSQFLPQQIADCRLQIADCRLQ
jgi:hypothetical protein